MSSFGRENRNSQLRSKQLEIRTIGGNDGCAVASGSECNQRIVLKVSTLVYVPGLLVANVSDKPASLPPVGHRRLPPDRGQLKKGDDESLRLTPASTAPEL